MFNDKQAASALRRELGQPLGWCHKVIEDFKRCAFRIARIVGVSPFVVMVGIARHVRDQEERDRGPDLEEEVTARVAVRKRKRPSLPPQEYTSEDVDFLSSV